MRKREADAPGERGERNGAAGGEARELSQPAGRARRGKAREHADTRGHLARRPCAPWPGGKARRGEVSLKGARRVRAAQEEWWWWRRRWREPASHSDGAGWLAGGRGCSVWATRGCVIPDLWRLLRRQVTHPLPALGPRWAHLKSRGAIVRLGNLPAPPPPFPPFAGLLRWQTLRLLRSRC